MQTNQAFFKPQMETQIHKKNYFKYILGFVLCILMRLLPFRPPNIEPIMATMMPFSKVYGMYFAFIFASSNILLYDIITSKIGIWTLITAITYGFLAISAVHFFKKRKQNRINYVYFAIIGTLLYDAITGLTVGPLFFHQPFMVALIGQIPFTLLHLVGNISFAFFLSPIIYQYVVLNKKFKKSFTWELLTLKKI